jgi:GTP cyclohydrolase III
MAVAVGAAVADRVGVGVGGCVTDAAGAALVALHAVRSNPADSDAAIHRDTHRERPTPTIIS